MKENIFNEIPIKEKQKTETLLPDKIVLIHHVAIENNSARGKQTFAEYVSYINKTLNFADVVNVFIPTSAIPETYIEKLI